MAILSYFTLAMCILGFNHQAMNVLKVVIMNEGRSGSYALFIGLFSLLLCIYFSHTYGWTF